MTKIYLVQGTLCTLKYELTVSLLEVKETPKSYIILSKHGLRSMLSKDRDINSIQETMTRNTHGRVAFMSYCDEDHLEQVKKDIMSCVDGTFKSIIKAVEKLQEHQKNGLVEVES